MRGQELDSHSSQSGLSRASAERAPRKPPRFSLRRFFCRRPDAARRLANAACRGVNELRWPAVAASAATTNQMVEFQASSSVRAATSQVESAPSIAAPEPTPTTLTAAIDNPTSTEPRECPLCLLMLPRSCFPQITTCVHRSCDSCLRQYLRIEIGESRVNVACPECSERLHPNDMRAVLNDPVLTDKYERFMLRRTLVADPDARWCPAPDCGYAVIATGCAGCPKLQCERPGCNTYFCYHCKQLWHPSQTCDDARNHRSSATLLLRSASLSYSHDSTQGDIKPCPRCGAFIIKMNDGSCNHMTCSVCGSEFCWLCMKEISDLHYLSPSGCTFWGKKPWSRKKKIFWQLGTLIGAPIGIGLVAGIAVPAMIIGIPVWVGRKLHTKYEHLGRHQRNVIIMSGVTASILISPALATLAVGVGVPVLLAYVYGVVPISLCRSGGCGVSTTHSGGVRFQFDEGDNATIHGGVDGSDPAGPSAAPTHHVNNPSLGPSIGEASVAMTGSLSGSQLGGGAGGGMGSDRESASRHAMDGGSMTGGGSLAGGGVHARLDVHVDLASGSGHSNQQKRASLSSESANFSVDTKSATVSFNDDASTKALAGSICTRDKDNISAIVPDTQQSSRSRRQSGASCTELRRADSNTSRQYSVASRSASLLAGGAGEVVGARSQGDSVSLDGAGVLTAVESDRPGISGGGRKGKEGSGGRRKRRYLFPLRRRSCELAMQEGRVASMGSLNQA